MKISIAGTINELRTDHRNMVMLLDQLDSEALRLADSNDADYELVGEIMTYMTEYPDVVHHPKEDLVYGYLKSIRDDIDGSLQKIETDHRALAEASQKICRDIAAISATNTVDRVSVAEAMREYSLELRKHMYWEEKTLFEIADTAKDDGKWAAVLADHAMADDPLFGRKVNKRFRKLFNHIQRRIVWDSQQYFV